MENQNENNNINNNINNNTTIDINNNLNKNSYPNNINYNKLAKDKKQNKEKKERRIHITIANIITILICIMYIYFLIRLFIEVSDDEMGGFVLLGLIIYGPIGFVFINGLYALWRLCEYFIKNKKFIGIKATITWLIICILLFFGSYFFVKTKNYIENKDLINNYNQEISSRITEGTISSIEGDIIYIRENNKLTPYIVVDNYYGYENNTLLLRKNVLNDPIKYIDDDLKNSRYIKYSDSLIDKYLQSNDWLKKFDNNTFKIINNTKLYYDLPETKVSIRRKFFIISDLEIYGFHTDIEWDYMAEVTGITEEWTVISSEEIVYNDAGKKITDWWKRIDEEKVTLNTSDFYNDNGTGKVSYIRPAFTIKSNTKIKKENNKWVLDIK